MEGKRKERVRLFLPNLEKDESLGELSTTKKGGVGVVCTRVGRVWGMSTCGTSDSEPGEKGSWTTTGGDYTGLPRGSISSDTSSCLSKDL